MIEYETTTIYVPVSDEMGWSGKHSDIMNLEVIQWLNANIGPQAPSYHTFIADLPEGKYGWAFRGKDYDPQSKYKAYWVTCYCVSFRNNKDASLFKLKWNPDK